MNIKNRKFQTRAVHGGCVYVGNTGAGIPPVFLTSTLEAENPDDSNYTRSGNSNSRLLEECLASLEDARFATCFARGVSAITAIVSTLKSGDIVVARQGVLH